MSTQPNIKPLSLKANTLWNSAGSMVYLAAQWLTTVLVVVLSDGYQNSGELAIAMAVGNIFAPIALFRIRTYQVSDLNDRFTQQNYVAIRFVTIAAAFIFTAIYCLITQVGYSLLILIAIYLIFKADEAFSDVLYGIDQRGQRMDYIGISQALRGLLSITAFVLGLLLFNRLIVSLLAMAVVCFLVTLLFDVPHARRFGKIGPSISTASAAQLLKTCFPAALSLLFCTAIVSISRQFFGLEFGEHDLGIYAAVATPAVVIQVSASYLYSPTIMRLTELFVLPDKKQFVVMLSKITFLILLVALSICVLAFLFGDSLLTLVYGDTIIPYVGLFLPVCIATVCLSLMWFFSDVLIILRGFKQLTIASAVALATCLLVMYPMINTFGMNGINLTIICAFLLGVIVALVFIGKKVVSANSPKSS